MAPNGRQRSSHCLHLVSRVCAAFGGRKVSYNWELEKRVNYRWGLEKREQDSSLVCAKMKSSSNKRMEEIFGKNIIY